MTADPATILDALDAEQRRAAEAVAGPVRILAGAGTGKTRTVTHRIAYAVATAAVPPSQVLAVTFTRRAAGELRDRLRALGVPPVQAATFHAAALRQLGYFWPRTHGEPLPELVDNRFALVARAAASVLRRAVPRTELRDIASEVDWARASLVTPAGYEAAALRAHRDPPLDPAEVAEVLAAYGRLKGDRVDFDDLLVRMADLLLDDERVAAAFRGRYRWFSVDEYQDTSPAQQRLLDAWLGDGQDLCVVGDVAQTVYTFAGADAGHLIGFDTRFPTATTVRLHRDYRSTPEVVELANRVLARARGPENRLHVRLEGQRPPGPVPLLRGFDTDAEEATAVAGRLAALAAAGVGRSETAVLVRTNAQAERYEETLGEAGIPYVVRGTTWFYDRAEVRGALRAFRAALATAGDDAAAAAVRDVLVALGHPTTAPRGEAARERWESLETLATLAAERPSGTTFAEYVAHLSERAAAGAVPDGDAVTIATLHAAKGLEWDAVCLVGVAEGRLPLRHAETDEQVEEERRLLYVGVTRAREHLWVSWARTPSRFLDGLVAVPARPARPTRTGRAGGAAARSPGAADALAPADRAVFERLRAWRLEEARTRGVPAYTVFTDETLARLAAERPGTEAAMLAVPGIGPAKADRYGAAVLEVLAGA